MPGLHRSSSRVLGVALPCHKNVGRLQPGFSLRRASARPVPSYSSPGRASPARTGMGCRHRGADTATQAYNDADMLNLLKFPTACLCLLACAAPLGARLTRINIEKRESPAYNGQSFGKAG